MSKEDIFQYSATSKEGIFQCIFDSDTPNEEDGKATQLPCDSECCGVFAILFALWHCEPATPEQLSWMLRVLEADGLCNEDGRTYPKNRADLLHLIHQRVEVVLDRNGHFYYHSIVLAPHLVKMDSFFQNVMNGATLIDVVNMPYVSTRTVEVTDCWRPRDMSMVTEYTLIVIYRWVETNTQYGHVIALKQVGGEVLCYDQCAPDGRSIGVKLDARGKMFADTPQWPVPIEEGAWVNELYLVKTEGDFSKALLKKRRFLCAPNDEARVASVRPRFS
jgi:hypothetical protein